MTVTNIYQKQIKYHIFNAVKNSELTELVSVFTIRPAFPTSVKLEAQPTEPVSLPDNRMMQNLFL